MKVVTAVIIVKSINLNIVEYKAQSKNNGNS